MGGCGLMFIRFLLCIGVPVLLSAESHIPKFVWHFGFAEASDVTPFVNVPVFGDRVFPPKDNIDPAIYVKNIKDGDVIWVQAAQVVHFINDVFPLIRERFILLVSDGDESFPERQSQSLDMRNFIEDDRVIHIFSQNIDGTIPSNKISPLPIGIDFHSITCTGGYFGEHQQTIEQQEKVLEDILSTLRPTSERKKRALIDFHLADRPIYGGEVRGAIANRIMSSGVIDRLDSRIARETLWRRKGQYAFSVSPHGNGLDCHRTWEDLVLGCIVIVKTSPLDSMYEGLPVVIVKDWSEINKSNFDLWLKQYGDAFTNPKYRERLTHKYWMNKIRNIGKL